MNLLEFLKFRNNNSANTAKERLQIIISHEKDHNGTHDFIPQLKQELIEVVGKYIKVDQQQIQVQLQKDDNCSVLELNVTLPSI